jgi:hypothetical protein
MRFVVYQLRGEPGVFVVTDTIHDARNCIGEQFGEAFERFCELSEMGEENTAFDEMIAKDCILRQGYYPLN